MSLTIPRIPLTITYCFSLYGAGLAAFFQKRPWGDKMFKMLLKVGALALGGLLISQEASATAIASDFKNGFTLRPAYGRGDDGTLYGTPSSSSRLDGIVMTVQSHTSTITKTESGNASVTFIEPSFSEDPLNTFSTWIGGQAIAQTGGYAFGTYTLFLTLAFTNLTGHDLDFLSMFVEYSGYWPGAGSIGAKVDNSEFEFARYSAQQSGPGIGDSPGCDTRTAAPQGNFNGSAYTFSGPPSIHCGVNAPDTSFGLPLSGTLFDFDNGATKTMTFTLSLLLEASSIPEPATLALFGVGLFGLAALRRRQTAAR